MYLLLEIAIKSTLLFSLVLLAYFALRYHSARLRHQLLSWGMLVAIVLLPLLVFMPHWTISFALSDEQAALFQPGQEIAPAADRVSNTIQATISEQLSQVLPNQLGHPAPAPAPKPHNWPLFFGVLWLIGTLYFVLRLMYQQWVLARIIAQSRPIANQDIMLQQDDLLQQLGIKRPVRLLMSPSVSVPISWGLTRSYVCLPPDCIEWSPEEVKTTLLHELIHIKYQDYLWHCLLQLAALLYWIHPLYWIIRSYQILEREKACDALVLRNGISSHEYARQLLAFAKRMVVLPEMTLPMARSNTLKRRIKSVLNPNQWNKKETKSSKLGIIFGLLSSGLILAVLYPVVSRAQARWVDQPLLPLTEESCLLTPKKATAKTNEQPSQVANAAETAPELLSATLDRRPKPKQEIQLLHKNPLLALSLPDPALLLAKAINQSALVQTKTKVNRQEVLSSVQSGPTLVLGHDRHSKITTGWSGCSGIGRSVSTQLAAPTETVHLEDLNFHLRINYYQEVSCRLFLFAEGNDDLHLVGPSEGIPFKMGDQAGWHSVDLRPYDIKTTQGLIAKIIVEEETANNGKRGLFFSYAKGVKMRDFHDDTPQPLAWYLNTKPHRD